MNDVDNVEIPWTYYKPRSRHHQEGARRPAVRKAKPQTHVFESFHGSRKTAVYLHKGISISVRRTEGNDNYLT